MSRNLVNRRSFLSGSLALAAGAALGREAGAQASRPREIALRWGIIGTGSRAAAHIAAIKVSPEMEIAAVCDVHEGRLRNGADRVGSVVAHYKDYRQLLSSPEIDAVVICTPNLFHQEMLMAALASGKHVLCEKPMATSLNGCRMMRRVIDGADRVVLFGLQFRYAGRYRDLYQQVKAGKIGRPRYLSLLEYRGDWNDTNVWQYKDAKSGREMNWRFSQVATGGTLNEKACHYLDILNWMTGALPERISCQGGVNVYRGRETWDHATVHLTYPGDIKAVHAMCLYGPPRVDFQIIGDEGSLQLMPEHILFQKRGARDAEQIALTPEVGHAERGMGQAATETAVLRMYEDFLDCVKRKKKPVVTADIALIASKMAFLAERSSQLQRELSWERGFGGVE